MPTYDLIKVRPASTGVDVAVRDQKSQLVDIVYPEIEFTDLAGPLYAPNSSDINILTIEASYTLLDVGESTAFYAYCEHFSPVGACRLTCLVLNTAFAFKTVHVLETKETGIGDFTFINAGYYRSPLLGWDLSGLNGSDWKACIHLTWIAPGDGVYIYGGVR